MKLKYIYLFLAGFGLIIPWYFNIQFYLTEENTSIINFIEQTTTTFPAKSINADISIIVIAFLIWMTVESRKLKIKHWWIIYPLTFLIAAAFSIPLFLYMRANRLDAIDKSK